jgi:hypothetical protein
MAFWLMCVPSHRSCGECSGEEDRGAHLRNDRDRDRGPEAAFMPAEQPVPVAHGQAAERECRDSPRVLERLEQTAARAREPASGPRGDFRATNS